jgi:hypothetical protein
VRRLEAGPKCKSAHFGAYHHFSSFTIQSQYTQKKICIAGGRTLIEIRQVIIPLIA